MDKLLDIANSYGIPGLVLLAFALYILHKDKIHREERREQIAIFERQHKEALDANKNSATANQHFATIVTELNTLIKSRL